MKIAEFQDFIREFPYKNQSFDIQKDVWTVDLHSKYLEKLFDSKETITLNRFDLFNSGMEIKEFVFKTLMWGYPTKGRGKNIDNLLKNNSLDKLIQIIGEFKENKISVETMLDEMQNIHSLGTSTITKFAYFLNTEIDGNKVVILDQRIIDTINSGRFEELDELKGIKYDKTRKQFSRYLQIINELSKSMNVEPDQIEIFLFTFGRNISELRGY